MAVYEFIDNTTSFTIEVDGTGHTLNKSSLIPVRMVDAGKQLDIYTGNTTFYINLDNDSVTGSTATTGAELRDELLTTFYGS